MPGAAERGGLLARMGREREGMAFHVGPMQETSVYAGKQTFG